MALSLLQEAQTARGLAAVRALSAMKQEDDRSSSVSPPITNPTAAGLYPGLHPATATAAMGMFAPQILANQTAAALMAYGFPLGTIRASLASTGIFPHHPALFGAWPPTTPPLSSNSANSNSPPPPASPISPALSTKSAKSAKLNNNYSNMNNNHIVSTTSDLLPQKKATKRKQSSASIKKETMLDLPTTFLNNNDIQIPNSMSPPTPGSSPQSVASMEGGNNITTSSSTTTKDPSKDKIFTCKICNRSFGYKHVLQNHERTHTGEKPFECPECHKRFTRDHHLKTHMRLHTGEKPYSCSHCDRQFVQVANLRRHLRVHTGERPYSCEICQSRFSDSNQLKAHMLIHNGEKPFECDRCHTKFRRRHHLMHHKCGIVSLPTPAISPSMSFSDHKSHSSEISDESLDLTKTQLNLTKCHQLLSAKPSGLPSSHLISPPINVPMNLSTSSNDQDFMDSIERRHRKSNEIRRLIRMPQQVMPMHNEIPEQTEPEDLSMHSPRSPVSLEDLEDLDDAATLYLKSQRKHLKIPMLKTSLLES